jgi:hypothetical protein
MTWLWYRSKRRGEKAHVFRDGAAYSFCGLVERAKAEHEVDAESTARKCRACWHGNVVSPRVQPVAVERAP